jgi:hypothetical protein
MSPIFCRGFEVNLHRAASVMPVFVWLGRSLFVASGQLGRNIA